MPTPAPQAVPRAMPRTVPTSGNDHTCTCDCNDDRVGPCKHDSHGGCHSNFNYDCGNARAAIRNPQRRRTPSAFSSPYGSGALAGQTPGEFSALEYLLLSVTYLGLAFIATFFN